MPSQRTEHEAGDGEPDIVRAEVDTSRLTRAEDPIRVQARLRWLQDGSMTTVDAFAVAWTPSAVEIIWAWPYRQLRRDWIPAADVRRPRAPRPG